MSFPTCPSFESQNCPLLSEKRSPNQAWKSLTVHDHTACASRDTLKWTSGRNARSYSKARFVNLTKLQETNFKCQTPSDCPFRLFDTKTGRKWLEWCPEVGAMLLQLHAPQTMISRREAGGECWQKRQLQTGISGVEFRFRQQ